MVSNNGMYRILICVVLSWCICVKLVVAKKLIVVMVDGVRWDDIEDPSLKGIHRIIKNGVKAKYVVPIFPSLSYPNWYTLTTGLYAESHGFISNNMYDPETNTTFTMLPNPGAADPHWWSGAEPLWTTAEKNNKKSALYWWGGCEVEIRSTHPSICERQWYDGPPTPENKVDFLERIDDMMEMFKTSPRYPVDRLSLAMMYYVSVDFDGHHFGVKSKNRKEALRDIDKILDKMQDKLKDANLQDEVNIMVVSDHGMTDTTSDGVKYISLEKYAARIKLQMEFGGVSMIIPQPGMINTLANELHGVEGLKVYKKEEIPGKYHIRNNKLVPPILLVAKKGYYITQVGSKSNLLGHHGYDPELVEDMRTIFFAKGPDFNKGYVSDVLYNTDLYNVMCSVLQIDPLPNNGSLDRVQSMLKGNVMRPTEPSSRNNRIIHCTRNFLLRRKMAAALSDEEFQRMQMQLIELRTKNYTLGEKNVKVQTELLQNNQLLEDLRKELSKCQKVISRSKNAREIEQFVQENEALQQKLQMQEDEFRLQNRTLVQEITSLETSNENLRKELELTKTQSTTFLNQDDKIKLEAENLSLRKLIESYKNKKDANSEGDATVSAEDVESQLKLSTATEEKRLLQDNMKRMESDYREQLLKMQTESEKLTEKLKKKQESFLILQAEKEQLYNESKSNIENLQTTKDAEILQLKEHMQCLQVDLKKALQFSQKLSFDEVDMDKDASVELDGEKATFDCSLNESRMSLITIQDKIQSMTQQLSEAENKIEKLEYEKDTSSGKMQEYQNKIAELEKSVLEKTKLAEKRKKMMDDMKEHLIETTNKQSIEIENLTRKLAEEQEAFKALFDKEKETEVKLIESRNEVQSLKEEVDRLRAARCSGDDKIKELEEKIQQIIIEHEKNLKIQEKKHSGEIEELNNLSKSNLEDLTIQLEVVKAEKTEFEDKIKVLQQEAKDSVDERKIQEKKGLSMVKDLKRQLQVERNRAEKLQERLQEVLNEQNRSVDDILQPSSERPKGDASSISSWSYVSGGTAERDNKDVTLNSDASSNGHESPNQELSSTLLETENTSLLAKVAQLQQKIWMLEEKVNHLEMSNEALVDDVLRKTALIQFYCMEGRSDPASASQDNKDKLTIKRIVDFIKDRGDENLREINRRMQRMLEETLTKNMHLQKDIETLSNEVSRLSKLVITTPVENAIQNGVLVDSVGR
ncbi:hypothetical protein JTE90_001791 [Oedothorax gibbosus]|uniref:Ectonucleotide pyrophosphatase/phosphodiesterase family member 6 n=1 Tax=Oedothorax gibbosus TaxID=931172 RepID=A0AAV6VT49_9ARAC|nr:hypothetical protein JTE90_001791 [Oedothorax gibbosus]